GGGGGGTTHHLHFFFHEVFTDGPSGTTATVAKPARGGGGSSFFGFVSVVDDVLREGADPSSGLVGRAQGVTAATSLSDGAITTLLNLVFTAGPYSGSTLQVFGRALLGTVMERPVVGGTGAFRMARGYTLSRRVNSTDPNNLLVLEYDVYVTTSPIN
ncbi:dirigent protein 2-like, partial [Oryza brachyantha]|uniref:dirigent protein 2-like n=1 Tax=Oryza brachyantha TaxID=4533 RepID=UPI001ADA7C2C